MSAPQTPTTKEISDNIVSQISAQIAQQAPILPKSFIRVLAKAIAGVYVILFKYAGFIYKQLFVVTATDQNTTINGVQINPLNEWGRLVGIPARTPATQAQLRCAVQVTAQGGFIRTGQQLVGKNNGVTYAVQGDVSINASTVYIIAQAVGDQQGGDGSGTIGNLANGASISFVNPLANVTREVLVISQEATGADAETTQSYRSRILDRFQKRPQGGAYADYEQWAEEAPGTLRAYPYTGDPGEVNVYIESSTEADGIPTTAQREASLALINFDQNGLASRRPINALVNVLPITRATFSVEVSGVTAQDLAAVQDSITVSVLEYFEALEPFINGLSLIPRRDRVSAAAISGIVNNIVGAAGGQFTGVTLKNSGGSTITVYDLGEGEKAKASGVAFL